MTESEAAVLVAQSPAAGDAAPKMADPASLIQQAVSLLEREMATGALAAKTAHPLSLPSFPSFLEGGQGMGVESLLSELQNFVDAFTALAAQSGPGGAPVSGAATATPDDTIVLLQPRGTARPGDSPCIAFKLHNDSAQPVECVLRSTELRGGDGFSIPEASILFDPRNFSLAPDGIAPVVVTVQIPKETPPAIYSGLVTASRLPYLRAVLTINVG